MCIPVANLSSTVEEAKEQTQAPPPVVEDPPETPVVDDGTAEGETPQPPSAEVPSAGDDASAPDQPPVEDEQAQDEQTPPAPPSDPVPTPPTEDEQPETPVVDGDTAGDETAGDDTAEDDTAEDDTAEDEPPQPPSAETGDEDAGGPDEDTTSPILETQSVMAGRVTTLDLGDGIASVEILQKPDIGNLTVNPDNTLALVLTGTSHEGPLSFSYRVDFEDGARQTFDKTLEVEPLRQLEGWSTGEHVYMLETDDTGDLVIEHGDNHRVVHISNSEDAMTREDLAEKYGKDVEDLKGWWFQRKLLADESYGSSPDMALDQDLGMRLWNGLVKEEPGSHWLLLERDHEYDMSRLVPARIESESNLHPMYIGAYGEGAKPVVASDVKVFQKLSSNVVIEDLELSEGVSMLEADKFILNDIVARGGLGFQSSGHSVTIRNSTIHEVVKDAPKFDNWSTADRVSGMFVSGNKGLLVENVLVDQVGWEEGYDYFGDPAFGQAPNSFSQNVYIHHGTGDVTFRDNISMRAASFGAQIRPGGFIEDNVLLDNNGALNALGGRQVEGSDVDAKQKHFTFLTDNLVTSAGAKEVAAAEGALSWGFDIASREATLLDNVITHLADPNNPEELAAKSGNGEPVTLRADPFYDDTMIYNWVTQGAALAGRNKDENVDHLDPDVLNQTTIQNFTAALLGKPDATIDDLGQFLRTEYGDGLPNSVTADDIIAYFQEGFGIEEAPRTQAETLRFVPSELADGVRWDNRINWQNTNDLPGTVDGDSVDLGGNWVTFATITGTVQDLDLGSEGRLTLTSGRLDVEGETRVGAGGGEIDIRNAGQLWLTDYRDGGELDIDVEDGRFANTGFFDGLLDMHVSGGQALLGVDTATLELGRDSVLEVAGSEASVGFDGDGNGVALLRMETGSDLRMVADETGFSEIGEFRSGAHDNDAPKVLSAFDMGEGTLLIDVTALAGGAPREEVLVDTDQVVGMFDGVEFVGLGPDQDATLTVDYDTDRVSVSLGNAGDGTGEMNVATVGNMLNAAEDAEIWEALTEGRPTYEEIDDTAPDPTLGADETEEEAALTG